MRLNQNGSKVNNKHDGLMNKILKVLAIFLLIFTVGMIVIFVLKILSLIR